MTIVAIEDTRKRKKKYLFYKMYKIVSKRKAVSNIWKQRYKILLITVTRLDACCDSEGKLFHNAAPLNEKLFCPFEDNFFGTLRSVIVSHR